MTEKRPAERVWECAEGLMYREAYSVLGNRNDSEDAVMEAMVRIIRSEDKFSGLGCNDMRALAVIYVRNTAIDIYNRNRKNPYPMEELPERVDSDPTPEESAADRDAVQRILYLIEQMPPSYRDVMLLKCRYEMENDEIAEVLRLEKGTVRTRLSRARAWLRKNAKKGGVADAVL